MVPPGKGPSDRSADRYFEDRDHPLVLGYAVEPDWLKPLGLPPAHPGHEQTRAQIAAIDKASDPQPWASYSRNTDLPKIGE
jgi:hypothetical protein